MSHSGFSRVHALCALAMALCLVLVVSFPDAASAQIKIRAGGGFVTPTGEVNDLLLGAGVDFSGSLLFGLTDLVYIGAGGNLSFLGGKSVRGVDRTDGGIRFMAEGIALIYLTPPEATVRPFVSGSMGFGALGWDNSPEAEFVFGTDSDGVGFFYFAPSAGLEFPVSDNVGLYGGARFSLVGYADETGENFAWDLDGGHFFEVFGGLSVSL